MKNYFYKPLYLIGGIFVLFILIGLLGGSLKNGAYVLGIIVISFVVGSVLSLTASLVKTFIPSKSVTIPQQTNTSPVFTSPVPAPVSQPEVPGSKFFRRWAHVVRVGTILVSILTVLSGFIILGMGGGGGEVLLFFLIPSVSGVLAMFIYAYGLSKQKNFVVPFIIFFTIISAFYAVVGVKQLLGLYPTIPTSSLQQVLYILPLIFNLLILYKYYQYKKYFTGSYLTLQTAIIVVTMLILGVFLYASINQTFFLKLIALFK